MTLLTLLACFDANAPQADLADVEAPDMSRRRPRVDHDHDGFPAGRDCDDNDPSVYPGAMEICDGVANDCNAEWGGDAGIATFYGYNSSGQPTVEDLTESLHSDSAGPVQFDEPGTLVMCPGDYDASILVTSDLQILGPQGAERARLHGDGESRPLTVKAFYGAVEISGVELSEGWSDDDGGGLACDGRVHLMLVDVDILDNQAGGSGGGLAISHGCDLHLDGGRIAGNASFQGSGGALWVEDAAVSLYGVQLMDNRSGQGAQGISAERSAIDLDHSQMDASQESQGAMIEAFGGDTLRLVDSELHAAGDQPIVQTLGMQHIELVRAIFQGGGDSWLDAGTVVIDEGRFSQAQGAMNVRGVSRINKADFVDNHVDYAVLVTHGPEMKLEELRFAGDSAAAGGGMVALEDGVLRSHGVDFRVDNLGADVLHPEAGGLYFDNRSDFRCDLLTCFQY